MFNSLMEQHPSPMPAAIGHSNVVEALLQAKADPNISMNDGKTPLYFASLNGNLPIVEQLLLMKAKPNTPCGDKWSNTTLPLLATKVIHKLLRHFFLLELTLIFQQKTK